MKEYLDKHELKGRGQVEKIKNLSREIKMDMDEARGLPVNREYEKELKECREADIQRNMEINSGKVRKEWDEIDKWADGTEWDDPWWAYNSYKDGNQDFNRSYWKEQGKID